jgi:hypothetical protein
MQSARTKFAAAAWTIAAIVIVVVAAWSAGLLRSMVRAMRIPAVLLLSILVVNSGWFLLVYHAGPAFGPTLLAPQGG